MKREKFIYLGLISLIIYLAIIDKNIFGSNELSTKVFDLDKIELTQIDVSCEVYLTKGDNEKLVIEAPEKIIGKIYTSEKNGILKIGGPVIHKFFGLLKVGRSNTSDNIKIYVNHNQLDRIIISEQAKIISIDYKPMSFHASTYEENEEHLNKFDVSQLRLSNMGLIHIFAMVLNRINS